VVIARLSTLFVAALLASPALWSGFVTHEVDPTTALLRFLVAVPVAAAMLAVLEVVTRGYGKPDTASATEPVHAEAVTGEPLKRRVED
jgi:hypothetical protein